MRRKRQPDAPAPSAADHDPDVAWRALSLVVDWIKHSEAKAGATLAATGVTAGVLYNITKDLKSGPASRPPRSLRALSFYCSLG